MKNIIYIVFILFTALLLSCNKNDNVNVVKNYNKNGQLESLAYINKDKYIDSSWHYFNGHIQKKLYYNKTGDTVYAKNYKYNKLESEGYHSQKRKIKKWKFYRNGQLSSVFEYVNLCGKQYTNQGWVFDQKNQVIKEKSNYYTISNLEKSYQINEPITFKLNYNPVLQNSKSIFLSSPMIEDDYCNIENVLLDSLFSDNHRFTLKLKFTQKTSGILRGYIKEYGYKNKEYVERDLFVEIPLTIE